MHNPDILKTFFLPISDFIKTDSKNQPQLVLRTARDNVYIGYWDDDIGYFMVDELIHAADESSVLDEIPGRTYTQPIAYRFYD